MVLGEAPADYGEETQESINVGKSKDLDKPGQTSKKRWFVNETGHNVDTLCYPPDRSDVIELEIPGGEELFLTHFYNLHSAWHVIDV